MTGDNTEEQIDLFTFKISAENLHIMANTTFSEFARRIDDLACQIGARRHTILEGESGKHISGYTVGTGDTKILIHAGCGTGGDAPRLAVFDMMASLEKGGRHKAEILSKSQLTFIPYDELETLDGKVKNLYLNKRALDERWSPQLYLVGSRLLNGVGDISAMTRRAVAMREFIENQRPSLAIHLQEAIGRFADLFFKEAGVLCVEHLAIPGSQLDALHSAPRRPTNIVTRTVCKIPLGVRQHMPAFSREYASQILARHPDFNVGKAMLEHVQLKGHRIFQSRFHKTMLDEPTDLPPLILLFDEARAVDGVLLRELGIHDCCTWFMDNLRALGYTSITFDNPLYERVLEHVALVEGAIMKGLRVGRYA